MTWTHRPGWGPCYPECDLSLMFTSVRWLPITECPLQFMSHWPRPWQQGRFLDPLLQRFKSISTQYLMNKMSRRQKKSIYSWNLTPASDPWQQVLDDHDKWNPDMEETSTKITCLGGVKTGSAASNKTTDNALFSKATVCPRQEPNNSQGSYLRYLPWDKSYPARSIFRQIEIPSTIFGRGLPKISPR